MNIYTPYFYIIQHTTTKMFYAGVRFSKNADPNELLREQRGYWTSSKLIRKIIQEQGNVFIIRKIKIFADSFSARNYETRFLKRIKATSNPYWYNQHENDAIDPSIVVKASFDKYGVGNPFQSPEIQLKSQQTRLEKYGVPFYSQTEEYHVKVAATSQPIYGTDRPASSDIIKDKIKETNVSKYGVDNVFKLDEFQQKASNAIREKYGVDNISQHKPSQDKKVQTFLEKYGTTNPSKHPAILQQIRDTNRDRYGMHPSQRETYKNHMLEITKRLSERPIVQHIRLYKALGFKLPQGYYRRGEDALEQLLKELIEIYGEIPHHVYE